MDGKKNLGNGGQLCAVASVGFVVPAGAEETMTHDLTKSSSKPTETLCRGL